MEYSKFARRREPYRKVLAEMESMGFSFDDLIQHHPTFAGHMTLARFLAFHEVFKKTIDLAGHIAEVGVWKGSALFYFAKLSRVFEPESATLVHGFDWYRGTRWGADESTETVQGLIAGSATSAEETRPKTEQEADELYGKIRRLIELQDLGDIVHLHNIDVTTELDRFFEQHPHMQFKIVFMDVGTYEATRACLPHFWPRLTPGGVLILDQYNHEISPGETRAVKEYLPDLPVHAFGFTNHPSAYVIKPVACI